MTAKLGEFIHFVLFDFDPTDEQSRCEYARKYWDLIPWLSREIVVALSNCAADNGRFRGDVRMLLELARREINDQEKNDDEPGKFSQNMIRAEVLAGLAGCAPTFGGPPRPGMPSPSGPTGPPPPKMVSTPQ
jgi:hypothetical protein